jgi:hypothetical protein
VQPYVRPHPEATPLLRASPDWIASRSETLDIWYLKSFDPINPSLSLTFFLIILDPSQWRWRFVSYSAINAPQVMDLRIAFVQLFQAK